MISTEISLLLDIKVNNSEKKYLNGDLTIDWNKIADLLPDSGGILVNRLRFV